MMTPEGRARLDELRQEASDNSLPWGGRSPRVLTKAYERFTLRREAAPLDEDAMLDEQYQRFLQS
jgi:hypothetical protein